ncbi:MAG TPA: tol-pal system-associated acyl-CoA thioesterase [Geminicoccaceae bacterium]|nr:tol-pal system-associated acyl-CoA thioesterase [Geminicoccaceae bacterium]
MTSARPTSEPDPVPASGAIEAGVHRLPLRVYYEDTDAGGIVYHAAYLRFAERARTELLRCLALDHRTLRERFGLSFAVRRCTIDYRAPARLDDELIVATRLVRRGGASLDLEQQVSAGGRLMVRLDVRLALLSAGLSVARLPPEVTLALAPLAAAAKA